MFRQVVSASSRALRSNVSTSSPQALLRTQFRVATPSYTLRPAAVAAAQPSIARWYSDAQESDAAKTETTEGKDGETDPLADLKKQLETKDTEARDWKDKCMRTVADFRNLQDRTAREVKSARDFAIQKFAKDLIDSVDNFERALGTITDEQLKGENKELIGFHEGVKMTETILLQTLAKHGLERLSPIGDKFNPNEHEATFMTPQPGKEDSTVFHVQQSGFKLNGRVLRAAKVGVVKNK